MSVRFATVSAGPNVLVVDDSEADAELIVEALLPLGAKVSLAQSLEHACAATDATAFDLAVLDLSLPDGWGLDTVLRFIRHAPHVPVIVVSGSQADEFEGKALRAGAVAFVSKAELGSSALAETATDVLDASSKRLRVPFERRTSPATAAAFGQVGLDDAVPDRFDDLVLRYADLLGLAIEQASFRGDYHVSMHLQAFARELGDLGGGPREVTLVHARAMEVRLQDPKVSPSPLADEEARLVVLQLMGHLVLYYRLRAMGQTTPHSPSSNEGAVE